MSVLCEYEVFLHYEKIVHTEEQIFFAPVRDKKQNISHNDPLLLEKMAQLKGLL